MMRKNDKDKMRINNFIDNLSIISSIVIEKDEIINRIEKLLKRQKGLRHSVFPGYL